MNTTSLGGESVLLVVPEVCGDRRSLRSDRRRGWNVDDVTRVSSDYRTFHAHSTANCVIHGCVIHVLSTLPGMMSCLLVLNVVSLRLVTLLIAPPSAILVFRRRCYHLVCDSTRSCPISTWLGAAWCVVRESSARSCALPDGDGGAHRIPPLPDASPVPLCRPQQAIQWRRWTRGYCTTVDSSN
ncbi:hypothetical protein CBL_08758 [Carabus blaptoides fortunei]